MEPLYPLTDQLTLAYSTTISQFSIFFPRFLAAVLVLLFGALLARWIQKAVVKSLELLNISKAVKNTPIDEFIKHDKVGRKLEQVVGGIVYWLLMLLVFHTFVNLLGLTSLVIVLNGVLAYIPKVFSAVVILFLGVLAAGVLESVVKGLIKSIDGKYARAFGKIASYLTLVIFILAAISELGIAQQFILILFIGFVTTITLSLGLSIGLGSKDVVGKMVEEWHDSLQKDLQE